VASHPRSRPYHAPPAAPRRPPAVAPAPLQVEDLALRGHARLHEPGPDAAHPRPPRPRRLRRRHGGLRRHLLLHDQARLVRPGHPRRRPAQARGQGRRERRRRGAASERARRARAARAAPGGGVDFAVRGERAARTAARRRHDPVRRVRGVRRSQGERSGQAADHGHGEDLRDPRAAPRGPRRRRLGDLRGHARRTRPTIGRIRFDSGPPGSPVDLGAGSS